MPHLPAALVPALEWLAGGLFRASTYGGVLIGVVWLVCRLAPRLPATVRSWLWWCAALKLVVDFAWWSPIPVPVLPLAVAPAPAISRLVAATGPTLPDATAGAAPLDGYRPLGAASGDASATTLATGLVAMGLILWGAGVTVILGRTIRRWRGTMAIVTRATPVPDGVVSLGVDLCRRLGVRRTPPIRMSAEVETPFVAGLVRPVVVLPARGVAELAERELRMALCHELAHVRRADVRLGCVPALAESLFFFHPLARLVAREYALGREAACDGAVLGVVDAAPHEYGHLLLGLGVARLGAGLAAAGASCSFRNLKRRIAMLRQPQTLSIGTRTVAYAAVALAVLALAPLRLVARTPPPPGAVADPIEVAAVPQADHAGGRTSIGPLPELPTAIPELDQGEGRQRAGRDLAYVLFYNDDHTTMSSGSWDDLERARKLRKPGERLLWFRKDGKEYIVRDAALLRQVEEIWRPVGEIGEQQGRIGAKQGEIGAKQGDIGRQQGEIGAKQGALGARQGSLGARQGTLAAREAGRALTATERAQIEKEHQQIDQEMRELDLQMQKLSEKMQEFDKPMSELGDQMSALGKQMDVLGRKMQEASARAESEMGKLIDRAIASGLAKPAK